MERKSDVRTAIDNARLTTKLSVVGGIIALLLLLLTLVMGVVKPELIGSDIFSLGVIPYSLALLFSVSSMIYGMLGSAAAQEMEEKILLEKRSEAHRALDVAEDVRFTAGRSFENYKRFAPYALAILGALITGGIIAGFLSYWGSRVALPASSANTVALAAAVMAALSIFPGVFLAGVSRQEDFRWLRAPAAWLLAGFGLMLTAIVVSFFTRSGMAKVDSYIAGILIWVFAVLGAEFAVSVIIEFYRPRTLREARPIFESKLLALFTEPGGVMRNIALALDYQFGFKVSGTWLYSFMERSFFPLLFFWALLFWGFTMIHEVGPSQVGVKERLGVVTSGNEPLGPGIYWTLPWPFGEIRQFSTTEIREIVVGESHDEDDHAEEEVPDDGHGHAKPEKKQKEVAKPVVLWTEAHGSDEDNFVVAVAPEGGSFDNTSIALVRMMIPVQFRIKNVMDFAYKNLNPEATLAKIGQQAATEYLASTPMMQAMSSGRADAQLKMQQRIQKLADEHELGVEIVNVLILDSHPPVEKVAPAFQEVIGAMEDKEAMILRAQSYAVLTLPEAEATASQIEADAASYKTRVVTIAEAESGQFKAQLAIYNAMPRLFRLKAYLDFLEKDCKDIRKFIVAAGLSNEVYELDFHVKERLDLVDTDLNALGSR